MSNIVQNNISKVSLYTEYAQVRKIANKGHMLIIILPVVSFGTRFGTREQL